MILTKSMQAINKKKILLIQVVLLLILQFNYIDGSTKPGDGLENLNYASNLSEYKKYTLDIKENESNLREPLYPILLSINIYLVENFHADGDQKYKIKLYKIINILLLLLLGVLAYQFSKKILKSEIFANLCFFILCFGHFFSQTNVFLSESLASIFLLIISFYSFKAMTSKTKFRYFIYIFMSIGIASYCKSIFITLAYFYLPIIIYLFLKNKNKKLLILFFIPYVILGPLYIWNYNKFDRITLGTENRSSWILAIRSYYLTINNKEYLYSYIYNNPFLKKKFLSEKKINNENLNRIDEINHKYNFYNYGISYMLNDMKVDDGKYVSIYEFYRNYSFDDKTKIKNDSIKHIINNPFKHLMVSVLMLYKSISFNDVNSIYYFSKDKNIFVKSYFYLHLLIGNFYIPIFLILSLYSAIKRSRIFFFLLPSNILICLYSLLTFYVPRYNLVLLPIILIIILYFLKNKKLYPKSLLFSE